MTEAERYSVHLSSPASRDFRGLPVNLQRRVEGALAGLSYVPRPSGCRRVQGFEGHYRIRTGQYRIVYEIDDTARGVTIIQIGHRREVYRSP